MNNRKNTPKIIISMMLLLILTAMSQVFAADVLYPFTSIEQQVRFERWTKQLRCVTCPNQTLSESRAPVAESMKTQVFEMIVNYKTDAEIEAFFKERYGDYVFYQPAFKKKTLLLWLGPLFFLIIGFRFIIQETSGRASV